MHEAIGENNAVDGTVDHRPLAFFEEDEPDPEFGIRQTLTVILRASRCPIGCTMCDLHHNAFPGKTPVGSIPAQVQYAITHSSPAVRIKLYNGGNFFDPGSIPVADEPAILSLTQGFEELVVENHPAVGRHRTVAFADRFRGKFEIAVGLESVRPGMLTLLRKRTTRDEMDRYVAWLAGHGISSRIFLMIGGPGHSIGESLRWAELSLRHAAFTGARHISLIPARGGEAWTAGGPAVTNWTDFDFASWLREVIQRLRRRGSQAVVTIDTWDLPENSRADVESANQDQGW